MKPYYDQAWKLLGYFRTNPYRAVSLDWLISKSKKTKGTVQRYIGQVRKLCPSGWRIRVEYTTDDLGIRWTWYRYCRTWQSFRTQQNLWRESA